MPCISYNTSTYIPQFGAQEAYSDEQVPIGSAAGIYLIKSATCAVKCISGFIVGLLPESERKAEEKARPNCINANKPRKLHKKQQNYQISSPEVRKFTSEIKTLLSAIKVFHTTKWDVTTFLLSSAIIVTTGTATGFGVMHSISYVAYSLLPSVIVSAIRQMLTESGNTGSSLLGYGIEGYFVYHLYTNLVNGTESALMYYGIIYNLFPFVELTIRKPVENLCKISMLSIAEKSGWECLPEQ